MEAFEKAVTEMGLPHEKPESYACRTEFAG